MFKNILKWERRKEKELLPYIDKLFYLGGILNSLATLPQVMQIYSHQDARGLSLITWSLYTLGSLGWIVYGIIHR